MYPNLATKSTLTVHIIGATQEEMRIQMMNEEFLHLLPKLERLIVGYIGPDLLCNDMHSTDLGDIEACSDCEIRGRNE